MAKLGTAYVEVQPDLSGLNSEIDKAIGPLSGKFGKLGKAAAVGLGAVVTGAGAAGKALYDIGGQFDDAYDQIRVGTGKTGKALEGLEQSFKNVVKTTPTDFGSASKAISDLNSRLGLTGKPLEGMSKRFLELSRITDTDLSANIESLTRTFGDWNIATGKQGDAMDKLFRASQKTGVPVAKLGDTLVKYGAPLRQLGFSFEQSAAMIGKFEKEGVNTQLVMGSLRVALGKMAKAGEDPQKTFARVTDEIKNAGTAGEANAKALELFGARAGPDMAAAIREGRFELGSLTSQIAGGKDTILGAAKDTQDFSEKWQIFKNRVLVGLEPLATRVFGAVGTAMDRIPQIVERLRGGFEQLRVAFTGAGGEGGRFTEVVTGLQSQLETFQSVFTGVVDIASTVWSNFGDLYTRYAKNLIDTVIGLADAFRQVLGGVTDFLAGVFTGDWGRAWDGIKQIFSGVWDAMKTVVTGAWNQIKLIAETGIRVMITAVKGMGSALVSLGSWILGKIVDGFQTLTEALKGAGGWLKNRVVDLIEATASAYVSVGSWVINRIADGITTITEALGAVGGWIKNRVVELIQASGEALIGAGRWIVNRVADGITTITEALAGVGGWIKNRVVESVTALKDGFTSLGGKAIGWIVDGLEGGAKLFQGFINKIIGVINKIPGVEIGKVSLFRTGGVVDDTVPGFARGGVVHHDDWFAKGGEIARPMVIVGEEAPKHPEFVIPTNPAYRGRALNLHAQLGKQLGVPGFALGGILGDLPGTGDLPDWIKGAGTYAIKKATSYIKKQIGSALGDAFGESFSGSISQMETLVKMVKKMEAIDAKGYPYSYGGGHNGSFAPSGDIRPSRDGFGYDCSGLVSAILHAGGLLGSVMSTDGLKGYGQAGDGKYVTIGVRGSTGLNAHTMMKLGNKYLESGSGHGAKWVNGWSGSFPIHRHPEGFAQGGILDRLFDPQDPAFAGWGLARGGTITAPFVGSYATGGIVPRDGLAYVHQGETITPAGDGVDVHVHVNDPALRDIIRVEIVERERGRAGMYRAGVRT